LKRSRIILLTILLLLFAISALFATPDYDKLSKANLEIHNATDSSQGSGVLIKIEGQFYVLTCSHITKKDDDFILAEDTITRIGYPLKLVKIDRKNDLALFKIFGKLDSYLEIADKEPEVGSVVYIISNPNGLVDTLTSGIISRKEDNHFLTEAKIFRGSSGGAVVYNDEIIGIIVKLNGYLENIFKLYEIKELDIKIPIPYTFNILFGECIRLHIIKNFLKDIPNEIK